MIAPPDDLDRGLRLHRRRAPPSVVAASSRGGGSRRVPLASIELLQLANDDHDGGGGGGAEDGDSAALDDDALLRACARRLLVGSIVPRVPRDGDGDADGGDGQKGGGGRKTTAVATVLRVPRPPGPRGGGGGGGGRRGDGVGRGGFLEFRVVGIEAAASASFLGGGGAAEFVVLPSTRIVFRPSSRDGHARGEGGGEGGGGGGSEGVGGGGSSSAERAARSPSTEEERALSRHRWRRRATGGTAIALPSSPHEHLVQSLHSVLSFQELSTTTATIGVDDNDGGGDDKDGRRRRRRPMPPVPRSFLLSGPPGVGKTHSVRTAIGVANSWHPRRGHSGAGGNGGDDAVRLVSIRGSELLSHCGSHAGAAMELRKAFEGAVSWAISPSSGGGRRADAVAVGDDEEDERGGEGVGGPARAPPLRRRGRPRAVVVFLDECDSLTSSSAVVAATLAAILDEMEGGGGGGGRIFDPSVEDNDGERAEGWERVIVVAATNRVDAIPDYLRRPGRLEREVVVRPPDSGGRYELLRGMLNPAKDHDDECDDDDDDDEAGLREVADACVGYVAADLSALVRRAATLGMERALGRAGSADRCRRQPGRITAGDLRSAAEHVGASCLRDASISAPPDTKWDDIAGDAGGAKRALREAIEWPRTRRRAFEALGLRPPRGVLLHGPPGCAKTTLARAAAGAAGVAFLSLGPADVYSTSYVGDAEAAVRRAFDLARSAAPCVLFFDEIDAIVACGEGGGGGHGMGRGSSAEARVLSTFLNEMDGVDGSAEDGVLVLGATNRPGSLDAALLRPGRFDRVVYVPQPDEDGRRAILSMECKKWRDALFAYYSRPSSGGESSTDRVIKYFDLDILASDEVSGMMTGAEIVGSCREAAVVVMRSIMMESHSEGDEALMSEPTAERHMQSLMRTLEMSLRGKTPLLSNADVLNEYTAFEKAKNNE